MEFSVGNTSERPSGCGSFAGKGAGTLFFGVFFLMGSLFVFFILGEALREAAPWLWTETSCTVVSSGIESTDEDKQPYRPAVRYQYHFEGQDHEGYRLVRGDNATSSFDRARDHAARYVVGQTATCRVSPNHPALAVLERRIPWIAFAVLFPLIFVAIGGIGLYAVWRGSPSGDDTDSRSISQKAAKGNGHKIALIVGLMFSVVGGALFLFLFALPSIHQLRSLGWTETPCTVIKSTVRSWSTDDGTSHRPDVLYEYQAGGRSWRSNKTDFFSALSSGYDNARDVVARHRDGSAGICWVDPGNPGRSILEKGFRPMHLLGLLPLAFLIAGAALSRWAWRQMRTGRSSEIDLSEETAPTEGPLVLEPQVSPLGKVFGALFFALFWNGIVSVFVFQAWKGWERGQPDWFLTLFLVPFVLVGLVMIGAVGYLALALANPRPRLTLEKTTVRLGDELRLTWLFTGRASRIRTLRILLEGREEATYQRGTDTHTDQEVFATHTLIDTGSDWEIPRGTATVVIPGDTMHSFAADNNKIVWELKVAGEIDRWPDVGQNFPITIRPMRVEDL